MCILSLSYRAFVGCFFISCVFALIPAIIIHYAKEDEINWSDLIHWSDWGDFDDDNLKTTLTLCALPIFIIFLIVACANDL